MKKLDEKISLLVAEDDRFNRLLIVSMLAKNKNIEVVEAKDGVEALRILLKGEIDILLLDIHMPKMNGLDTLREIRQMKFISNIPIMVISSDEEEEAQCLALGANSFTAKPIKLKELEKQIYSLLEERIS